MRVIISGGGTGGHIFPALAIANELKRTDPEVEILFVGALGRMEMEKIPAAGYEIKGLPVAGFQRKLSLKNLTVLYKLWRSMVLAKRIIKWYNPDVVIGVGGYASGPTLKQAQKLGIPTLVQEQNSYAGVTNKLLAAKAERICVAYENMERYFPKEKLILTGNPVRREIVEMKATREEGIEFFNLKPNMKTILVVGGSLGARTVNDSVIQSLNMLNQYNVQLIWQTGKLYYDNAHKHASGYKNTRVFEFINRMDLAFAAADLVISRAGAGTISELQLIGKPCIFVPSPNVAEDHQTKNALALVEKNAALMVKDSESQKELFPKAVDLIMHPERLEVLSTNLKKLGIANSAERIVKEIRSIVKK